MTTLKEGIALVDRLIADHRKATHGLYVSNDYDRWKAANAAATEAAKEALVAAGAVVRDSWQGAAVKLAGIRATSTSGLFGAMQNWLRAARRKVEEG